MTNAFNFQGQGIYAQGNPPYTETTRQGKTYNVSTATAFAPVAAVPTTLAKLEIFNNTTGQAAMSMIVEDIFAFQLLSTAAVQTYGVWAMVTTQKAAPTNTALDIFSQSGLPKTTTTAASRVITAVDTTVVANGWRPYGPVQAWGLAAATPGNALVGSVDGRLIVPPLCSLCVVVIGSIGTASSFQCGASWAELQLGTTLVV